MGRETPRRLGWRWATALGVVAGALRISHLGTFSLGLDELYLVCRAHGTPGNILVRCVNNAEHPPLSALAMSLGYGLGLSDDGQRLLTIALSVGALVLLAMWAAHHFGRRVGVLVGIFGGFSTYHVRYSQELRPYAWVLFFAALTLVVADRMIERPTWRTGFGLAATLAAGLYAHVQFLLVLVPVVLMIADQALSADRTERRTARRALGWLLAALGAALLTYTPWMLATVGTVIARSHRGGVVSWTWWSIAQRWQVLTATAREFDPPGWTGGATSVLAVLGVLKALRVRAGRAVIAGALVAIAGVEALLLALNHWSSSRYDLIGWAFILVLIALGADYLWSLPLGRLVGPVAVAVIVVGQLPALDAYLRIGRPAWDRLADVVRLVAKPRERVFTENQWSRMMMAYYLEGKDYQSPAGADDRCVSIDGSAKLLAAKLPAGQSALVVLGRWPHSPELWDTFSRIPFLAEYFNTARLYRITPQLRQRLYDDGIRVLGPGLPGWPEPTLQPLPDRLTGQPPGLLAIGWSSLVCQRQRHTESTRLEFDAATTSQALAGGWSRFEATGGSPSFAWATGYEAGLGLWRFQPRPLLLRIRLWAYHGVRAQQRMRGLLNGRRIWETTLTSRPRVLQVEIPGAEWRPGRNLLVLQFESCAVPAEVERHSGDRRPLAAAVDWLELVPVRDTDVTRTVGDEDSHPD